MRSIQLFSALFIMTIAVSISYGEESNSAGEKTEFAEAATMLHGVWACDVDKTAEGIKNMEDLELEEGMIEMMMERVKTIELEFHDGKFQVDIGDQSMAGEWKVTRAEKKDDVPIITINVIPDDESEGEEKTFEIHFMGEETMKMIDRGEESPPIVMARKSVRDKDQ